MPGNPFAAAHEAISNVAGAHRAHRRRVRTRHTARPKLEGLEERVALTSLPPGFTESLVATGLGNPTAMTFAPDGRLFVLEQEGNVDLVRSDGTIWTSLHINVDSAGERGMLGIAFDPHYAANHFVYLYYTNPSAGAAPWSTGEHNQISRFTVNDSNPRQPLFGNEAPILDLNTLSGASNHNGGAIHFGLDGMLYADAGDNVQTFTQGGNTYRVSQSLGSLLGKQLRINVAPFNNGTAMRDDTRVGQLIPSNNPFVGTAPGINQLIYNLGLRNPFTFAIQPRTGLMYVNDVGENTWEEINQSIAGANYGWSGGNTDGFGQHPPGPGVYHDPLLAYNHSGGPAGGGIAIVGGDFYNPLVARFPSSYIGKYFYSDLAAGWIRVFDPAHPGNPSNPDTSSAFAVNDPGNVRDVLVGALGNLNYLTASNGGAVYRITYHAPAITAFPHDSVPAGSTVTLQASAVGSPLQFQWQHLVGSNWQNIAATTSTAVLHNVTAADAGQYRVIVSNSLGSSITDPITLKVHAKQPPKILVQPTSQQASTGGSVSFTVNATGAEPLRYQWQHLVNNAWRNVGPNAPTFTIVPVHAGVAGRYRVIVSNTDGRAISTPVVLTIKRSRAPRVHHVHHRPVG